MSDANFLSDQEINLICAALKENKPLRKILPEKGILHIDRQLPFLYLYRTHSAEDIVNKRILKAESCYLIVPIGLIHQKWVKKLIESITTILSEIFLNILVIEIWESFHEKNLTYPAQPKFCIVHSKNIPLDLLQNCEKNLSKIEITHLKASVEKRLQKYPAPPKGDPIMKYTKVRKDRVFFIGIEISPIYKDSDLGAFPLLIRSFRSKFSVAIRKTVYEFALKNSLYNPTSFLALGKQKLNKIIYDIDQQLSQINQKFDFLSFVTPTHLNPMWQEFKKAKFTKTPKFLYLPLPINPLLIKRDLFKIPVEKISDPAIEKLFRDKQLELDLQLDMLLTRDSEKFLYCSLQLYGAPTAELVSISKKILSKPLTLKPKKEIFINSKTIYKKALEEFSEYQKKDKNFQAFAEIKEDLCSMMVCQNKLLIKKDLKILPKRLKALLQHEIGTHLITYHNGLQQPLKLLSHGMAGYEQTQEGLAVLSEYLVGGLTLSRLKILAARVLISHFLISGQSFCEAYHLLQFEYDFEPKVAFNLVLRIYRGGGLTKDLIYLKGFIELLQYFSQKDYTVLFMGKLALNSLSIIKELSERGILKTPALLPLYFQEHSVMEKLKQLRQNNSVLEMLSILD